jgi:hypothetical protein
VVVIGRISLSGLSVLEKKKKIKLICQTNLKKKMIVTLTLVLQTDEDPLGVSVTKKPSSNARSNHSRLKHLATIVPTGARNTTCDNYNNDW